MYTVSKGPVETLLVSFTFPCSWSRSKTGFSNADCFDIEGKLPTFQASGKLSILVGVVNFKVSLMCKVPIVIGTH